MFRYYSSYALVYSNFTHLLCCGIPTIIGLSSLLTSFSFFETLTDKLEIFESYEVYLFALTTLIFMMFISAEIYKRRTNCTNEDEDICCSKYECNSSNKKIKLNMFLASFLYAVNGAFFLSEIVF
ncbi:MAG: hypothetical protein ACJ0G4_07660 [Alphaproteobacteria bacterium]|tara:strand:- start:364 stop:738 length:375 start_codon:yes stop_codon:yes gene_type:complete